MAITYIGGASEAPDTTNTATMTHGVSIQDGDLVIFFLDADGDASNRTAEPTADTNFYEADVLSGHVRIDWTIASSEPSDYVWTYSTNERQCAQIAVFRGVDPTAPFESTNLNSGTVDTGGDSTATFTSLTPGEDNCAVITYIANQEGNGSNPSFSNWPTTIVEDEDASTPGSGSGAKSAGFGHVIQTTAAAVSGTVDVNHGDDTNYQTWVIALRPAAIAETVGASAGVATVSGIGSSTAEAVGASAGVATVSGVAEAPILDNQPLSLLGWFQVWAIPAPIGGTTTTGDKQHFLRQPQSPVWASDTADGVGVSDGVATVTAVGASTAAGDGASAGVATVSGVGSSTAEAVGASAGVATVSGIGASTAETVGASVGVATVSGVGASEAAGDGASAGVATVSGVGESTAESVGSSVGVATVSGVGSSTAEAVGASTGVATVLAVGAGFNQADGTAAGTSTVTGVGASTAESVGASAGIATVLGVGLGETDDADQTVGFLVDMGGMMR